MFSHYVRQVDNACLFLLAYTTPATHQRTYGVCSTNADKSSCDATRAEEEARSEKRRLEETAALALSQGVKTEPEEDKELTPCSG